MNLVANRPAAEDASGSALVLAQRMLAARGALALPSVLRELAGLFHAGGAGLADMAPGGRTLRERLRRVEPALPWTTDPLALMQVADRLTPLAGTGEELHCLCVAAGSSHVLWLESSVSADWTQE